MMMMCWWWWFQADDCGEDKFPPFFTNPDCQVGPAMDQTNRSDRSVMIRPIRTTEL